MQIKVNFRSAFVGLPAVVFLLMSFIPKMDSTDVLKKMYSRYAGNWYKSFTFTQTTETFRNDSLLKTATWHEYIIFPGKFRIDFGEPAEGNAAIFTPDSVYRFRSSKLVRTTANEEDLTFLLGGMYFMSFDSVKTKMKQQGYDLAKYCESTWMGKPVYIIGASGENDQSTQLWIDQKMLVPVKFIRFSDGHKEEGQFYNHQAFGRAWSETGCDFYRDGKLIQKETYYNCKANVELDPAIFDPFHFTVPQ